jgi:molybdate transport repressor ModE-like protein
MDTLDPERLVVFRAVARSGGFSAAARELGRSQPSVSQLVAALEQQLGRKLFIREGRTIALTTAGELLVEHADRILAEMTRTFEHLASAAALREGRVALGTTDTLACHLLPPALGDFR